MENRTLLKRLQIMGFRLVEPDDHLLELWYGETLVGIFTQQESIKAILKTAEYFMKEDLHNE
jgi:hypothetical protein